MIKPDDLGEMIFRSDFKDGKRTVYMMAKPPKAILLAQEMLTNDKSLITVTTVGHVHILTKNARAVYKLAMWQMQNNAMTLELVEWDWVEPPAPPNEIKPESVS